MYSQTHRKTRFFAAAAFSILFMMLFAFIIPGMKASAANPPTYNYKPSCVGGKYYFTISEADYSKTTYSNTYVCSSRDGNYFVIKPNTGTSGRYCRVTVRNRYGVALAYIDINQLGVPTYTPSRIACTGGSVTSPASGADYTKTEYSYKAVCNSISGGKFIINANSTTSERECKITVKNSAGRVIYYIYIKQAAVKLTPKSIAGGGSSFGCQYQTTVSLTPTVANTIDVTASAPSGGWYNYTVNVSTNPSTTASRPFDINVKNSSGNLVEIIRVTQEKYTIPTPSKDINFTAQPVSYTFAGAVAKVEYTKPSMILSRTKTGNTYTFNVTQNPDPTDRINKVTFKDKYGTVLAVYTVKQGHAPIYEIEADEGCPTYEYYHKSGVETFIHDTKYVNNVTKIGNGKFAIIITANPSTTASRTFYITAKNSSDVIVEIIKITQPPHEHYYTYKRSGHVLSLKCSYCTSIKDGSVSYKDYIGYVGLADNVDSVKAYLKKIGYAEGTKEYNDLIKGYKYVTKTKNREFLQKYASKADSIMEKVNTLNEFLVTIGDKVMNDKAYSKTVAAISISSDLLDFFTKTEPAAQLGSVVKLAGDFISLGLDDFTGGYLSYALSAVGDAIEENISKALNYYDKILYADLYAYDASNNKFFEKLAPGKYTTVSNVLAAIKAAHPMADTTKKINECAITLMNWKILYEDQKILNEIYSVLGESITMPTNDFWGFVESYLKK